MWGRNEFSNFAVKIDLGLEGLDSCGDFEFDCFFLGGAFFVLVVFTKEDGDGVRGRQRCFSSAIFLETGLFLIEEIMEATFCRLSEEMIKV